MLRFTKRFRASLNLSSGKNTGIEHLDKFPGVSLTGAYKINQNEFINGIIIEQDYPKKITPSMIKLQSSNVQPIERSSKSTSDLRRPIPEAVDVRNSSPNISQVNNNQVTRNQIKEQKSLEKKRIVEEKHLERKRLMEQNNLEKKQKNLEKKQLAEQKKRDKITAQEQKKEEKLRKQPRNVRQTSSRNNKVQKRTVPQPVSQPNVPNTNPVSSEPKSANRQVKSMSQTQGDSYSTNTLESSISRSSGPPPYAPPETVPNTSDDTGNTRFASANDTSSWDLISQHRKQINRPKVTKSVPKQTHLDLNYNVGSTKNNEDNSEA